MINMQEDFCKIKIHLYLKKYSFNNELKIQNKNQYKLNFALFCSIID